MANWNDIRHGIDRFVIWTKESAVLSGAAKVALRSIPVVGPTLADIYEEAGAQPTDTALVLEILARIEAMGATGLEQSANALEAARAAEQDARAALTVASTKLGTLHEELGRIRADMAPMRDALDRLEAEVRDLAWGAADFDTSSPADQAALLVLLEASLSRSGDIFGQQVRIADGIIGRAHARAPRELAGKDDVLWWLSRQGEITGTDRAAFRELREITDRMKDVNLRVRWLVRTYGAELPGQIPVDDLVLHLSTWLTKYEYLREHADEHMALVFVGVPPTSIPFPSGADAAVSEALRASMHSAGLAHVVD